MIPESHPSDSSTQTRTAPSLTQIHSLKSTVPFRSFSYMSSSYNSGSTTSSSGMNI
ncbi:hypothetical protein BT96DRAFT_1017778 [Gymnopus androsaceus JB14]|uniref:Uncharacterized protein n=1 Tax=Gymnopus androsaceus JB14 TaxID=1447944 RepID=A0A6A4HWF3_9AGAR|nr:hypothetical protein BT96DRAFT_1017778 [Gymnopus androsaceus JB14]